MKKSARSNIVSNSSCHASKLMPEVLSAYGQYEHDQMNYDLWLGDFPKLVILLHEIPDAVIKLINKSMLCCVLFRKAVLVQQLFSSS